jgi:hypothetical protein
MTYSNAMGASGTIGPMPDTDWKVVGTVCQPTSTQVLDRYYEFQRQLNRIAEVKGYSKIWVDGRIGPATLKLYSQATGGSLIPNCSQLAVQLNTRVLSDLRAKADALNAPAVVKEPVTAAFVPKSTANSDGTVDNPPGFLLSLFGDSLFSMLAGPAGLVVAAGMGFAAYKLAKVDTSGRGRGRSKKSSVKARKRKSAKRRSRR